MGGYRFLFSVSFSISQELIPKTLAVFYYSTVPFELVSFARGRVLDLVHAKHKVFQTVALPKIFISYDIIKGVI